MNGIVTLATGQRDAHPTGPSARPTTVDCDDNGGRCVRLNGGVDTFHSRTEPSQHGTQGLYREAATCQLQSRRSRRGADAADHAPRATLPVSPDHMPTAFYPTHDSHTTTVARRHAATAATRCVSTIRSERIQSMQGLFIQLQCSAVKWL